MFACRVLVHADASFPYSDFLLLLNYSNFASFGAFLGSRGHPLQGVSLPLYTFLTIKETLKGNSITKEERRKVF